MAFISLGYVFSSNFISVDPTLKKVIIITIIIIIIIIIIVIIVIVIITSQFQSLISAAGRILEEIRSTEFKHVFEK